MAQVKATFKANKPSMARFLMSDRVADVSHEAAEDIAQDATNLAPQADPGDYRVHDGTGGERAEGGIRRTSAVSIEHPGLRALELGTYNDDRTTRIEARHYLQNAGMPYHVPQDVRRVLAMSKVRSKG